MRRSIAVLVGLVVCVATYAGDVEIVKVRFHHQGGQWRVDTTLRHADAGWEHYADAWRVVMSDGSEIGTRVLHHPHENEQPFTRSLSGLSIPAGTATVYVEAHDKVHGWSPQRVEVRLDLPNGERYEVTR